MLDDVQRNCFANMMAILLFHFSQKYHEEIVEIVVQKWANISINIFSFFLSFSCSINLGSCILQAIKHTEGASLVPGVYCRNHTVGIVYCSYLRRYAANDKIFKLFSYIPFWLQQYITTQIKTNLI